MTDAAAPDGVLTLALPAALEDELLDLLRSRPDLAPGFSLSQGFGLGAGADLTTSMEKVQGRARRVFVQVVMQQQQVPTLIGVLSAALPSPDVAYWVTPLTQFGRLA